MNFTPSRKSLGVSDDKNKYDHDLQLYREIPDLDINLDEFEEWAIERLKGKKSNIHIILFLSKFFFKLICIY
jgi:hypothetical protein